MQARIKETIKAIEKEYNVKVLYACESGSRAWGFPSPDSDYDVRFIYAHSRDWYLSILERKDTIEKPINDLLDLGGWDIKKTLRLMNNSNAVVFEWLQSPIVYYEAAGVKNKMFQLKDVCFSLKKCVYHYLSQAKKTYAESIKEDEIKLKKYFYVIRPLLAAMWAIQHSEVPPMELNKLLPIVSNDTIKNQIQELVLRKASIRESGYIEPIVILNTFIEEKLEYCEASAPKVLAQKGDIENVNQLFRELINEY